MVTFLLELPGVDVNAWGKQGYCAIFYALQLDDQCEEFLDVLKKYGADFNVIDKMRGWTVLHWAVIKPKFLLDESIQEESINSAAMQQNLRVLRKLLDYGMQTMDLLPVSEI
eukprot:9189900-Pyramimonas_sp.AAC.1